MVRVKRSEMRRQQRRYDRQQQVSIKRFFEVTVTISFDFFKMTEAIESWDAIDEAANKFSALFDDDLECRVESTDIKEITKIP